MQAARLTLPALFAFAALPAKAQGASPIPSAIPSPTASAAAQAASSTGPGWPATTVDLAIFGSALAAVVVGVIVTGLSSARTRESATAKTDKDLEADRIFYGFWLVVGGLLLTLAVVIVTVNRFGGNATMSDVIAIITAVTGVIGTLTAAFFGIQAAGAGRSQAISALNAGMRGAASGDASLFKLEPASGPHAGNTRVSITGNNLSGTTGVNFGTAPGTNLEVVNDGLMRITSPAVPLDRNAMQLGKSDVTVTVVSPAWPNRTVGTFYYYTIELSADNATLNIYGTGLTGATALQFGTADPVAVTAESDQQLQIPAARIPTGVRGGEVEVAVLFAPDTTTKRSVIGRFRFPPLPAPQP